MYSKFIGNHFVYCELRLMKKTLFLIFAVCFKSKFQFAIENPVPWA